jgi:hypothetical protein
LQHADGSHFSEGVSRCLFDAGQDVQHPLLPRGLCRDGEQEAVVVVLGVDDVARQVQNRQPKKACVYQHQHVEDSAGSAVPVGERVDGLELVVRGRHSHERVKAIVGVDESFPFSKLSV